MNNRRESIIFIVVMLLLAVIGITCGIVSGRWFDFITTPLFCIIVCGYRATELHYKKIANGYMCDCKRAIELANNAKEQLGEVLDVYRDLREEKVLMYDNSLFGYLFKVSSGSYIVSLKEPIEYNGSYYPQDMLCILTDDELESLGLNDLPDKPIAVRINISDNDAASDN